MNKNSRWGQECICPQRASSNDGWHCRGIRGHAYCYFTNKEDIFHELIKQVLQTSSRSWQQVFEMQATLGERLVLLVSRLTEARHNYPEIYQLLDQVQSAETTPANLDELIR